MTDYLFVPGIFQGTWVWDRVVGVMEDAFRRSLPLLHRGFVPSRWETAVLPGRDPGRDGRVPRLADYVSAVVESARREGMGRPVLVAHSTGAPVVLAAASALPEPPSHIVLVAGVVPEEGKSTMDALWWRARLTFHVLALLPRGGRGVRLPRPLARFVLAPELDYPTFALIYGRTVPEPLPPLLEPVRWREGVRGVPITYLLLEGDRFFPPDLQRRSFTRLEGARSLSLPAGHYAPLTHAEAVARILLDLARPQG